MPLHYPSVLIEEYRYGYTSDTELLCYPVFPSDRKGYLVGLHELFDIIIAAPDKDADEFDALPTICLVRPLKFRSFLLALWSPVSANVHHHRSLVCCLVLECLTVNGLKAEVSDRFISIRKDRKKNDYRNSP